jgi:hypothetical protein
MDIIEHAEKFLGRISKGWKEDSSSDGLQVMCFKDAPFEAVDTFMTAGLSLHELKISGKKKVRQELILPMSVTGSSDVVVSLLLFFCDLILRNHDAVLRGQIIQLPMGAAEKFGFDAVYCAIPVFMNDEFATFGGSQPPTVIVWMMPIYKSESDYVSANGWSKFENLLEKKEPDLFSLEREPII